MGRLVVILVVIAAGCTPPTAPSRVAQIPAAQGLPDGPAHRPGERGDGRRDGAVAFEDGLELTDGEQQALLGLARQSVEGAVVPSGRLQQVPAQLLARFPRLATPRGTFVTLMRGGRLRGCIGSLSGAYPLAEDVLRNALSAAFSDDRFPPVARGELADITIAISVLGPLLPVDKAGDALARWLGEQRPGLLLHFQGRRSTFLPDVWDELPRPVEFLAQLCRKQDLPLACWRDPAARFQSYVVQRFSERSPGGR